MKQRTTLEERKAKKKLSDKLRYERKKNTPEEIERVRVYRENNKNILSTKNKEYCKNNQEKIKERKQSLYLTNKESGNLPKSDWRIKNIDKARETSRKYYKDKYHNDELFRIKQKIRKNIKFSFKRTKQQKKNKTTEIIGCSLIEFKLYLESKFETWMNWDNYGLYNGSQNHGWDIDHIIPLITTKTEEDIIRLNHYTNLQPLCSYVNRVIKRDKI
jgi:hypothetical protein